ncbi:hypothetical protein GCM10017771_69420 [Streptomyces capitiformicae]|uniref:Uncharacterized protein n=1 Tax=Streptomyces capitiformicae TaxID=2014920 RepID=A0A918ZFD6_9ACTN|nr:hypothetical protein GCM10017771_69420 [Streptomyces capitiformicae]
MSGSGEEHAVAATVEELLPIGGGDAAAGRGLLDETAEHRGELTASLAQVCAVQGDRVFSGYTTLRQELAHFGITLSKGDSWSPHADGGLTLSPPPP